MTRDSSQQTSEFIPLHVYRHALHQWMWVAAMVLAGALAGWGLSMLRPPVYEARALFTFNIDYTLSGVLTDVEEDQALEAAGDLVNSSEVRQRALAALATEGLRLSEADLKSSASVERRNTAWLVTVRRGDGEEAARIANAWGEAFDETYREAYGHAQAADGLQRYLRSLESCLRETVSDGPAPAGCRLNDLAAVQAELKKTGEAIQRERLAGKNIFAGMLYEWSEKASTPTAPARFDRNKFLLAGALIGFLAGLWLVEIRSRRKA